MLKIAVVVVHVLVSFVLILFILLHAGRGGGLSEMFGGSMSAGGSTLAERNLDRLTVIAASTFAVTTVVLHFLHR